jgi:hypothetical protein
MQVLNENPGRKVCRSTQPIDIKNLNDDASENFVKGNKKPVLEIITRVSTAVVSSRHHGPPPPPQPVYDEDGYDYDYSYSNNRPYRGGQDDGMKIMNVEETVMVINSPYVINALKAVVEYYPGCK